MVTVEKLKTIQQNKMYTKIKKQLKGEVLKKTDRYWIELKG